MGKYKVGDEFLEPSTPTLYNAGIHRHIVGAHNGRYDFVWNTGTPSMKGVSEATIDEWVAGGYWIHRNSKTALIRKFKEIYGKG